MSEQIQHCAATAKYISTTKFIVTTQVFHVAINGRANYCIFSICGFRSNDRYTNHISNEPNMLQHRLATRQGSLQTTSFTFLFRTFSTNFNGRDRYSRSFRARYTTVRRLFTRRKRRVPGRIIRITHHRQDLFNGRFHRFLHISHSPSFRRTKVGRFLSFFINGHYLMEFMGW